jgi:hypothetical protein
MSIPIPVRLGMRIVLTRYYTQKDMRCRVIPLFLLEKPPPYAYVTHFTPRFRAAAGIAAAITFFRVSVRVPLGE